MISRPAAWTQPTWPPSPPSGGRGSPRPHGDRPPAASPQPSYASPGPGRLALPGCVPRRRPGGVLPGRGQSAEHARQICASCPVRELCLDYALRHGIVHGIWGGLTERNRRALRSGQVSTSRRKRDEAILAADAAGYSQAAISRAFSLARTSVNRVLSRDTDEFGRS